jgi:hypothetical protein
LLQWALVDRSRLDQRTQVPLPLEDVGLGYEFEHEGQRWRMIAVGNARDIGFGRARAEGNAYVCCPVVAA